MSIDAEIDAFLNSVPGQDSGGLDLKPGADGDLPTLTVQGNEPTLPGLLPGTAALIKETEKPAEKPFLDRSGRPLPTLESGVDPVTGLTTLTAGAAPRERTEGIVGDIQKKALVGTFAALESFGVPTRALGATVREQNPFASKEDKGKTWDEVFSDPDSGIFKEARKIVRNSDMNGAVKFILEMGISIPEDPLSLVGGLIGAGKSATRQVVARKTAKSPQTALKVPDSATPDLLLPAGKVDQTFTPAQKELVATGKVSKETAKKELTSIKNAPDVKREIDAGRSENVVNSIANIRENNGLTNIEGRALFESVEGDVGKAISTYKKEVNELYKGVNDKADPTKLGVETKELVKDRFNEMGIAPKPSKVELAAESERRVRLAMENGTLDVIDGRPFDKATKEFIDVKGIKIEQLGPSDLGISPSAFGLLHRVKKSLARDVTLKVLRKNKTTIQSAIQVARRAGDDGSVAMLEKARAALKDATKTQLDDVIGNPELTKEWLLADDFLTQNAGGLKAAGGLMYDKAGNPRNTAGIIREFNKVPTKKKGRVIESMMDFFDESGMQNLRNLYFNDIVERSSKGGFTGQKLRNVINSQPETVFNKVFTPKMKEDMSQLLADAISDDIAKKLTKAKLGTFTAADKQSVIKTIFGNPAYRIWATTSGFTKATMKRLSIIATIGMLNSALEKRAVRSAASFLKATDDKGLTGLTFKSLTEGGKSGVIGGLPRAATITTQRNLNPESTQSSTGASTKPDGDKMDSEIDALLQGL